MIRVKQTDYRDLAGLKVLYKGEWFKITEVRINLKPESDRGVEVTISNEDEVYNSIEGELLEDNILFPQLYRA
jgi:hypothetical protein